MRTLIWFLFAVLITLPWLVLSLSGHGHEMAGTQPAQVSFLTGIAIIGAAFCSVGAQN
jgi:hypothetical protein